MKRENEYLKRIKYCDFEVKILFWDFTCRHPSSNGDCQDGRSTYTQTTHMKGSYSKIDIWKKCVQLFYIDWSFCDVADWWRENSKISK